MIIGPLLHMRKGANQLGGNRASDSAFVFRYIDRRIHLLFNPKFQASSHLLWLYSLVCVGNLEDRFLMTGLN